MAEVCNEITEWIEEEVTRPIEEWVEQTEEVCKGWPWPLNWICEAVTTLIKVVVYVVDLVGRWVTRTVCTLITEFVKLIINIFTGLWDVLVGIFTLDWSRILDGLGEIFGGIIGFVLSLIRIVFLGDTIDFIIDEWKENQLKKYVRSLLENKYRGDTLEKIKDALSLEHGAFGFRIKMKAIRTFVDSEYKSDPDSPPDLWQMNNRGEIDLMVLCGFEFGSYWNRSRYVALLKGPILAGGGGLLSGSESFTVSKSDLEEYINNNGVSEKQFIILSMQESVLDTKLTAGEEAGRDLGLLISWEKSRQEINKPYHIIQPSTNNSTVPGNQVQFLNEIIGRKLKSVDPAGAVTDLCTPVAVSVFRYIDEKQLGLSTPLMDSECFECADCGKRKGLSGEDDSGVTFRDRIPDFVFKYVPIHELGHYFGLCHALGGLDRIMYKNNVSDCKSWRLVPEYIYFKGRPSFILSEARQAWDYIVANFDADCLSERHE